MSAIRIRTIEGDHVELPQDTIDDLASAVRGEVCAPGTDGYEEARTIWNAMIDRRPGLVIRCAGAADVMRAVRFARERDGLVSVRGGGHNIAGLAVADGALMIDLSLIRSVHVDEQRRVARVAGGCTLGDFDHEAQAFGLATPTGINSTTGIAGLTLGGGFGWLSRKYGMTIDNLRSVDIVTADGELRRASDDENADLFWGVRGGGGNFGIVTSFEFDLHPVGPEVLSGLIVHPFDDAGDVLREYREFVADAPDELALWVVMRQAPPLPFLPEEWHGREVLVLPLCWAGRDVAEGERAIAPMRTVGNPIAEMIGVQPYAGWQQAFDPLLTPGARNYWKSHNLTDLDDGLLEVLIDAVGRLPTAQCEVFLGPIGAATRRVPADAMAYAHRETEFVMNVHSRWESPDEDAACTAWARELFDATAPFALGTTYVNFMAEDDLDRVQTAGFGPNHARLVEIKNRYDPTNLFRVNQNVRPAVPV